MAMEIRRIITGPNDTSAHDGLILCVAYNPQRREIFTGSQDTTIKTWLSETGEHVRTLVEHKGWVTGLAYSSELRLLFSCSIDGRVLVWNKVRRRTDRATRRRAQPLAVTSPSASAPASASASSSCAASAFSPPC
jgi:WD40 repeat protein